MECGVWSDATGEGGRERDILLYAYGIIVRERDETETDRVGEGTKGGVKWDVSNSPVSFSKMLRSPGTGSSRGGQQSNGISSRATTPPAKKIHHCKSDCTRRTGGLMGLKSDYFPVVTR